MAKIALFMLFVVFALQLSSAARIPRDAPQEPAASPGLPKSLDEFVNQIQTFFKENINQEQLDKLRAFGDSLGAKGKELFEQASADLQKLSAKSE